MDQYEHEVTDEWAKETLMKVALGVVEVSGLHHRQAYSHFRFGKIRYLFKGDAGRATITNQEQAAICLEYLNVHEDNEAAAKVREEYHRYKTSLRDLLGVPPVGTDSSET